MSKWCSVGGERGVVCIERYAFLYAAPLFPKQPSGFPCYAFYRDYWMTSYAAPAHPLRARKAARDQERQEESRSRISFNR